MGLFISKQIVAAHHGPIDVRSNAEEGTVFTVRLPRDLQRVLAATAHDPIRAAQA